MDTRGKNSGTIWVIGGGKFGLLSAESMRRRRPGADIWVVDNDPAACRRLSAHAFQTVCADGVDFLDDNLNTPDFPDWIIPVIPIHLTCEWVRRRLSRTRKVEPAAIPPSVAEGLPNAMAGKDGGIFVSIANFICPENCPEPPGICTHTGKKKALSASRAAGKDSP